MAWSGGVAVDLGGERPFSDFHLPDARGSMSTDRPTHRISLIPPGRDLDVEESRLLHVLNPSADPLAPEEIPGNLPKGGGWLIVVERIFREIPTGTWLDLARSPDPWALLILSGSMESGEMEARAMSFSAGYPEPLTETASRLRNPDVRSGYVNHRSLLQDLSHHRHDVNNALTSALAETQFMRMDTPPDSEMAEGLELVEGQLRRIRDLVAELTSLRVRRR